MTATVVIATRDRPDDLRRTLCDWRAGTRLPVEIRVVDASLSDAVQQFCAENWGPLSVRYIRSRVASAAQQRNAGAEGCATELIIFCDDDVELPAETLQRLAQVFERDTSGRVGGVAGTIVGLHHRVPSKLLRRYYRIQAGFDHEHFGGLFFGAAINTLPTDRAEDPELYPSAWLNSTLVAYRTDLFHRERFPDFDGYSFQEDVNLSARIGRTHSLYFHRGLRYVHKGSPGVHKANGGKLAAEQIANRWHNAGALLGLSYFEQSWKFLLSVLLDSVYLARRRPDQWPARLWGSWLAWTRLAVLRHALGPVVGSFRR